MATIWFVIKFVFSTGVTYLTIKAIFDIVDRRG
jgi:hypothetical protein